MRSPILHYAVLKRKPISFASYMYFSLNNIFNKERPLWFYISPHKILITSYGERVTNCVQCNVDKISHFTLSLS